MKTQSKSIRICWKLETVVNSIAYTKLPELLESVSQLPNCQISTHHRPVCPWCAVPGSRASSITSTHLQTLCFKKCLMKTSFFKKTQKLNQIKPNSMPVHDLNTKCPTDHLIPTICEHNLDAETHQRFICLIRTKKKYILLCGKKYPGFMLCFTPNNKHSWTLTHTLITWRTFYNVFVSRIENLLLPWWYWKNSNHHH